RRYAINACLEPSLARLDREAGLRECFGQLAIFKDDTAIPLAIVARLWHCGEQDAEERLIKFHKANLLKYNGETKSIRLHDMIRGFLHETHNQEIPYWNQIFLETYATESWHTLSSKEIYLWHWLGYHLVEA